MQPNLAEDVEHYFDLMTIYGESMQFEYLQDVADIMEKRMEAARNAVLEIPNLKIQSVVWMRFICFRPIHRIECETGWSRRTIYRYLKKGLENIRAMNKGDQAGKLPEAGSGAAADQ